MYNKMCVRIKKVCVRIKKMCVRIKILGHNVDVSSCSLVMRKIMYVLKSGRTWEDHLRYILSLPYLIAKYKVEGRGEV